MVTLVVVVVRPLPLLVLSDDLWWATIVATARFDTRQNLQQQQGADVKLVQQLVGRRRNGRRPFGQGAQLRLKTQSLWQGFCRRLLCVCVCTTRVAIFAIVDGGESEERSSHRDVCVCVYTHSQRTEAAVRRRRRPDKRTQYSRYGYFLHSNVQCYAYWATLGCNPLSPDASRSAAGYIIRRVAIAFCLCVCVY